MDAAGAGDEAAGGAGDGMGAEPPAFPVVVAGTTGGVPAVAKLMRVVARLASGSVILPGLDLEMAEEVWDKLEDGHPQAGMRVLLTRMGATRGDVNPEPATPVVPPDLIRGSIGRYPDRRVRPLSRQLELPLPLAGEARGEGSSRRKTLTQPSPAAGEGYRAAGARRPSGARSCPQPRWPTGACPFKPDTAGLHRLEPADQQEEAVAIALALRHALEQPDARAALVTPDRAARLAGRRRAWRASASSSTTAPARSWPTRRRRRSSACSPAPSPTGSRRSRCCRVLKHPLAAFGLCPAACRRAAPCAGTALPARPGAAAGHRRAARRLRERPRLTRPPPTCSTGSTPGSPRCSPSPTPATPRPPTRCAP